MGLFGKATSINTLAWATPMRVGGSLPLSVRSRPGGEPGDSPRIVVREAFARWERDGTWQRNYEAWMANAVSTLR